MSFSMKCWISYIVMFLFLAPAACGRLEGPTNYPGRTDPSPIPAVSDMETIPDITQPRLIPLDSATGAYYDTKFQCTCYRGGDYSIPDFTISRCIPQQDLAMQGCLVGPGNSIGAPALEPVYSNIETKYKDIPFYKGEHCGQSYHASPYRFFTFSGSTSEKEIWPTGIYTTGAACNWMAGKGKLRVLDDAVEHKFNEFEELK